MPSHPSEPNAQPPRLSARYSKKSAPRGSQDVPAAEALPPQVSERASACLQPARRVTCKSPANSIPLKAAPATAPPLQENILTSGNPLSPPSAEEAKPNLCGPTPPQLDCDSSQGLILECKHPLYPLSPFLSIKPLPRHEKR